MSAKVHARPAPNGTYTLSLTAANGEPLWNDNQERPAGNLKRDLARIKRATVSAVLVIDEDLTDE